MALELNGSNQYLTAAAGLGVVNFPISISCLVYLDQLPFDAGDEMAPVHINKNNTGNDWITLRADDTNGDQDVQANVNSSGTSVAESNVEVTANVWEHYGGTFDDASRYAYLNGIAGPEENTDRSDMDNWVNFYIGAVQTGGGVTDFVEGAIAEVGIWNAILTPAEQLMLSKHYSPKFVRPGNLVHYYSLVRDVVDEVGGMALTPINAPTVRAHPRVIYPGGIWVPHKAAAAPGVLMPYYYLTGAILPSLWATQKPSDRRDFMKRTLGTILVR